MCERGVPTSRYDVALLGDAFMDFVLAGVDRLPSWGTDVGFNGMSMMAGGSIYSLTGAQAPSEAWIFRDDIGAPNGIKGYEEQVNSVGMHHGHTNFTSDVTWNTWNSAT